MITFPPPQNFRPKPRIAHAFAEFYTKQAAEQALHTLQGKHLFGRPVRLDHCQGYTDAYAANGRAHVIPKKTNAYGDSRDNVGGSALEDHDESLEDYDGGLESASISSLGVGGNRYVRDENDASDDEYPARGSQVPKTVQEEVGEQETERPRRDGNAKKIRDLDAPPSTKLYVGGFNTTPAEDPAKFEDFLARLFETFKMCVTPHIYPPSSLSSLY